MFDFEGNECVPYLATRQVTTGVQLKKIVVRMPNLQAELGPDILTEQTRARSKANAAGTGMLDSGFAPESGTAAELVGLAPFRNRFDGELVAYS